MSEIIVPARGLAIVRNLQVEAAVRVAAPLSMTTDTLAINETFLNQTENKTLTNTQRLAIVNHDTATEGVSAPALMRRHKKTATVPSSWHYVVDEQGNVWRFVDETTHDAWHAGISRIEIFKWNSRKVSNHTIGIEHLNPNNGKPLTQPQFKASVLLYRHLARKHNIKLQPGRTVFQHRDVAVFADGRTGRKTDARSATIQALVAAALAPPEEKLLRPLGFHRVNANPRARVRQGPATTYPTAMMINNGTVTMIDAWKEDERKEVIQNQMLWGHMATGQGFISGSLLELVQVLGDSGEVITPDNIIRVDPSIWTRIQEGIAPLEALAVTNLRRIGINAQVVTCGGYVDEPEEFEGPGPEWYRLQAA